MDNQNKIFSFKIKRQAKKRLSEWCQNDSSAQSDCFKALKVLGDFIYLADFPPQFFVTSCLLPCSPNASWKKTSTLKEKNLLPAGANSFPLEYTPFQMGSKHILITVCPEAYLFHLCHRLGYASTQAIHVHWSYFLDHICFLHFSICDLSSLHIRWYGKNKIWLSGQRRISGRFRNYKEFHYCMRVSTVNIEFKLEARFHQHFDNICKRNWCN